jgi:predicted nucleic acid-binding protein
MTSPSTVSKRMSGDRTFLDTNILLYLLSGDPRKADLAEGLVVPGATINVQILNEFASTTIRKLGMKPPAVRDILRTIRRLCTVRDLTVSTHDRGFDLAERYGFSLYDALVVAAAIDAGCQTLYTEDMQHGQRVGGLIIRNPFMAHP